MPSSAARPGKATTSSSCGSGRRWPMSARAKTPTLFVHGEQDNDVHITEPEAMYMALRRQGVDAAFARYPREGHRFREPKHNLDALRRTLEWMDRFVMGAGR